MSAKTSTELYDEWVAVTGQMRLIPKEYGLVLENVEGRHIETPATVPTLEALGEYERLGQEGEQLWGSSCGRRTKTSCMGGRTDATDETLRRRSVVAPNPAQ